jgi:hypothetical protein
MHPRPLFQVPFSGLGGQVLNTTFGSRTELTAVVPPELYQVPGTVSVTVRNSDGKTSNALPFAVLGNSGPTPQITRLHPTLTPVGRGEKHRSRRKSQRQPCPNRPAEIARNSV